MAYDGMTYTTNLHLKKPGYDSNIDVKDFDYNFDRLDNFAGETNTVLDEVRKTLGFPMYSEVLDPDYLTQFPNPPYQYLYMYTREGSSASADLIKNRLLFNERFSAKYNMYRADFYTDAVKISDTSPDGQYTKFNQNHAFGNLKQTGGADLSHRVVKISGYDLDDQYASDYEEDTDQAFSVAATAIPNIITIPTYASGSSVSSYRTIKVPRNGTLQVYMWNVTTSGQGYEDRGKFGVSNRAANSPQSTQSGDVDADTGVLDFSNIYVGSCTYVSGNHIRDTWNGPIEEEETEHTHGSVIIRW